VEQQELPRQTGGDASSPNLRARSHGHALAAGLAPQGGLWVLDEAHGDEESELWPSKAYVIG
jgi:hypothetical protein